MKKANIRKNRTIHKSGSASFAQKNYAKRSNVKKCAVTESIDQLQDGQKVLLYYPQNKDVIDYNGKVLGKKRRVVGTGYVTIESGRAVIDSERLGRIKVLRTPDNNNKSVKQKPYQMKSFLVATPIEE